MKKALFIIAILLLQISVFAQDVPTNIEQVFQTKFPELQVVEWATGDETYTAVFWLDELYSEAIFSKKGEWLETSTILEVRVLAESQMAILTKEFQDFYITYLMKIEQKGRIATYSIDLKTPTKVFRVTMDLEGKILKKELLALREAEEGGY
jgi:hypothetical protein